MYKLSYKLNKLDKNTKTLLFNDLGDAYTKLNELNVKQAYETILEEEGKYCVLDKFNADDVKEWWAKELADQTFITIVGIHKSTNRQWDAGNWNHFALFYCKDNELRQINARQLYWASAPHAGKLAKENSYAFMSSVLGMDRTFEVVYNLSAWLYGDGHRLKASFHSYN